MIVEGWKYYNYALIPTCAPNKEPNLDAINKDIWDKNNWGGNTPFLIRYATNYNLNKETNWWYIVKDEPIDINKLNRKVRYEINKGLNNFIFKKIDPKKCYKEMTLVADKCFETYPKKYRPVVNFEELDNYYFNLKDLVYGAFKNKKLVAFITYQDKKTYYQIEQLKFLPEQEKDNVNKALIYYSLEQLNKNIEKGKFVTNGERNLVHETNFNENLISKFKFKKIYCKLNIIYNPKIKLIINILFPIRNLIKIFDINSFTHNVISLLKMEEIVRNEK